MDITTLTDQQLMSELAGGQMNALGELIMRHRESALALAVRTLGDRDLAGPGKRIRAGTELRGDRQQQSQPVCGRPCGGPVHR